MPESNSKTATKQTDLFSLLYKLALLADEMGNSATQRFQARPDGYHAVHVSVNHDFDLLDFSSRDTSIVPSKVEIQVTTLIQETISGLLHYVYERARLEEAPSERWQWNHGSTEFAVNYLGHTLHYLEGMIVVARERQV